MTIPWFFKDQNAYTHIHKDLELKNNIASMCDIIMQQLYDSVDFKLLKL